MSRCVSVTIRCFRVGGVPGKQMYPLLFSVFGLRALGRLGFKGLVEQPFGLRALGC